MESPSEDKKSEMPLAVQIILLVGLLGVMVILMYYSFTYPYPSGKPPSVASFVLFWLRELIFLAFAAVALVCGIAAWLVQLIRRIRAKGKDAL